VNKVPAGWRIVRLSEVAGKPQYGWTSSARAEALGLPLLRTTDITNGPVDWAGVPRCTTDPADAARYLLRTNDIVVSRAGSVGVSALIDQPPRAIFASYLMRLRPGDLVLPRFLALYLASPSYWQQISDVTNGIALPNINGTKLGAVRMPLPPLEEQRRIVDILEDHLSRLDAAGAWADGAERKFRPLVRSILKDLVPLSPPPGWRVVTVAEAGAVSLGRQRHPDWHTGPEMRPYLRVANVFEDRIDTRDVMEMDFSGVFDRFRLEVGDVLLNEGQSPEWLGRPAIYRGDPPDVAFTNSILRFRAGPDVLPEWALLVFRRHMHLGRFMRESRITTNIAHLSAGRLKTVEFPVPPIDVQRRLVEVASERLGAIDLLRVEIAKTRARSAALRRALLDAAFSGRLTGAASDLDRVEELAGV